jgi:hypothetical protein
MRLANFSFLLVLLPFNLSGNAALAQGLVPIGFCARDSILPTTFTTNNVARAACSRDDAARAARNAAIASASSGANNGCIAPRLTLGRAPQVCATRNASFSPGAQLNIQLQPPTEPADALTHVNGVNSGFCARIRILAQTTTENNDQACGFLFFRWNSWTSVVNVRAQCGYVCR